MSGAAPSSLLLFGALMVLGGGVHLLLSPVSWAGFIGMSFFYSVMFYLGSRAAVREEARDFRSLVLAGRELPLGVGLLTMTATWVGGGFINGTAESVATLGLAWTQAPWGYSLSLMLGGLLFARPMRSRGYTTLLDPMDARFGKRMAAVLYLPALCGEVFWSAAILSALGTTFGALMGLDFTLSIIVSAVIAVAYTALGGLRAVANTDVFQLLVLILGLYLALPFLQVQWGEVWVAYGNRFGSGVPWSDVQWWDSALLLVLGGIPWHGYFQRVLSTRSPNAALGLSLGAGVLCLVAALPAVLVGMASATTSWEALGLSGPSHPSMTLVYTLQHLAPPFIALVGLGAVASAVMSSVDSSILSASTMGVWNVARPLTGREDQKHLERILKRLVWIVGGAATLIALEVKSVYALWFLCSDLVYCLLFPQLVCALFDPRANTRGSALAFGVALVLRFGAGEPTLGIPTLLPEEILNLPYRTLTMVTSLLTLVVVSRLGEESRTHRQI